MTMNPDPGKWRTDGVKVVRSEAMADAVQPSGAGIAVQFSSSEGRACMGQVVFAPGEPPAPHTHRRQELGVYVLNGRGRVRWGDALEFAADVHPGDYIYFAPFVPHQEINTDPTQPLVFIVVWSDTERTREFTSTQISEKVELIY